MKHVGVSDHAVLRYLERVGGFEIEKLRSEISAAVAARWMTGVPFVTINGARFVVREEDGQRPVVATVMLVKPPKRQRQEREFDDEI